MIDHGKKNVLGVMVDAVDYEAAVDRIIRAAEDNRGYSVSALAIHGVMTTVFDSQHRARVNRFDLVTPDGQGVRWAVNGLHGTKLPDRVYGPRLTLDVCEQCAARGLPVFLYGSRPDVLEKLSARLVERFPNLQIAGCDASKFRVISEEEQIEIAQRIRDSGARVVLAGLGCPRQEVFAYEYRDLLSMPCLAVGAAFDYHAGLISEPPAWMQRVGFHGFYRAFQEPRRLWKRFFLLPPLFVSLFVLQRIGLWKIGKANVEPVPVRYG